MKRSDLINFIAVNNPSLSPKRVETIVLAFFEIIETQLIRGGRVEIRGFGVFETRSRDRRTGRNPKTNTQVEVGAKRVPFFRPGKEVRKLVRKKSDQDD
jgi:integration host factor subunit beta